MIKFGACPEQQMPRTGGIVEGCATATACSGSFLMACWGPSGLLKPSDDVGHQTERASQGNEEGDGHRGSATGPIINAAGPAWGWGSPARPNEARIRCSTRHRLLMQPVPGGVPRSWLKFFARFYIFLVQKPKVRGAWPFAGPALVCGWFSDYYRVAL